MHAIHAYMNTSVAGMRDKQSNQHWMGQMFQILTDKDTNTHTYGSMDNGIPMKYVQICSLDLGSRNVECVVFWKMQIQKFKVFSPSVCLFLSSSSSSYKFKKFCLHRKLETFRSMPDCSKLRLSNRDMRLFLFFLYCFLCPTLLFIPNRHNCEQ